MSARHNEYESLSPPPGENLRIADGSGNTRGGWRRVKRALRNNLLLVLTIIGVCLGLGIGVAVQSVGPSQTAVTLIYFPGEIFLRMLQMLIIPLIVASLVSGVSSLDVKASGKLGRRAVIYYMATTLSAVVLGIILVMSIRPGGSTCADDQIGEEEVAAASTLDTFLDLIRNMFPDNLVQACFEQTKSVPDMMVRNCSALNGTSALNASNSSCPYTRHPAITGNELVVPPPLHLEKGMNILGLIVFSIALGIVLSAMKEQGKPLIAVFDCLNEATMRLVQIVMWYSPIGIMFLIMGKIASQGDFEDLIGKLGLYTATVMVGLVVHALLILPAIYFLFLRKNPYAMFPALAQALATAFGTSSSSATLPVTIQCLEENLRIDKRITRFVLPIGATINMDGTALYEAVAALFIAQYTCTSLNFGHIVAVSVTATAASIGAAGIPQAGLFTMVIVLSAVGLPPEYASLVFTVDWMLDRFRTMVNVLGDSYGASIVAHLSRHDVLKRTLSDQQRGGRSYNTSSSRENLTTSFQSHCAENSGSDNDDGDGACNGGPQETENEQV